MINIVLEGPKGSGKSTISDYFRDKGFEYFHSSSETENDLKYHIDLLNNEENEKRVIDRFSFGEIIYPDIYERESKLNWPEFDLTISDENTLYVVLYSSDLETLIKRIDERGRKTKDEDIEFIKKSNFAFRFLGNNLKRRKNIISFDISKYNSDEIIKEIEEKFNNEI